MSVQGGASALTLSGRVRKDLTHATAAGIFFWHEYPVRVQTWLSFPRDSGYQRQ